MAKRKKSLLAQLYERAQAVNKEAQRKSVSQRSSGGGGFWEDNTKKVKSFSETVREQNAKALRSGTRPTTTTRTLLDTSIKRQQRNELRNAMQNPVSDMQNAIRKSVNKKSALANVQDTVNRANKNARRINQIVDSNGVVAGLTRNAIKAQKRLGSSERAELAKVAHADNRGTVGRLNAGLSGDAYVPEIVTKEQQQARRALGEDFLGAKEIQRYYKSHPLMAGFSESYMFETPEQINKRAYGTDRLDPETMEELRSKGLFKAGRVLGELSQYAAMSPAYGALGEAGTAARGAKAGVKALAKRSAAETAINTPTNMAVSMRDSDSWSDFVKNFTANEVLDFAFGGLFNVPGIRKNVHFNRAMDLNQQALRAATRSEKEALETRALNELKKLDYKRVKSALGDITPEQADELVNAGLLTRENSLDAGANLRRQAAGEAALNSKRIIPRGTDWTAGSGIDRGRALREEADRLLAEQTPPNVGYHAGDLDKSEFYFNMATSNRGTGHFGTGTYFVGDRALIGDGTGYAGRPQHTVNFDGYNLYRPKNATQGNRVHDTLHVLNDDPMGLVRRLGMADNFDEVFKFITDAGYSTDNLRRMDSIAESVLDRRNLDDARRFVDEPETYFDELQYKLENLLGDGSYSLREMLDDDVAMVRQLAEDIGRPESEVRKALDNAADTVSAYGDPYSAPRDLDSASTVFMKDLGFEGVDVRGIDGLDNVQYGSVIYDLKPAKEPTLRTSNGTYRIPSRDELESTVEGGVTILNNSPIDDINKKDYRAFVKRYMNDNMVATFDDKGRMISGNPIHIMDDGTDVYITKAGVNEIAKKIRGGAMSKEYANSTMVLDDILRNARKTGESPNLKGRGNPFTYYESRFMSDGRLYNVEIHVQNTPDFNQYYYHNLIQDIKIEPANGTPSDLSAGVDLFKGGSTSANTISEAGRSVNGPEAEIDGVKTIRESTPEEMFDPEIRAQQDARINEARTQAEEISGVDRYGNPRAVNNQRVTQGVRQAEAGASSPEATRVINEDTYVRGENASVGRGVRETQEDAYLRWRDNPDNALYRLTQATDGLRKQDQIPKGYQSLQEYFADVHEGLSYYQNMQNTATDAITRQRAIEGEANVLEASWKVASNIGSGFRQYQELLRGTWQGQLEMINRQIENIEKRYAKVLKGKKITRLDPDDSLTAMLKTAVQSKDSEKMAEAMHDISVWIWDQVPASKMEKANAWRMTAMLMNPRTHARNIIGNALFRPAVAIKDFIGTGAERYAIRRGLVNREDATKAVVNRFSKEGKELREAARASWDANMRTIRGESKYYENARTGLANRPMTQLTRDGKKISVESGVWSSGRNSDNPIVRGFRKGLDSISGLNSTALDFEDVVFMRSKYVDSYAKVLKARGWDPANLTAEQAESAMEAAGEEALRSTYRDANSLANALNKWKRVDPSRSAGGKTLSWFIETELPFTKTPINLVRRAKDYSPVGLFEGLVRVGKAANAKDSKAMVAAIDRLCSGATGTGIFAIGAWLSNMGIVNGQLKEGDEGWYQQDLGYQNYALNIGGDNGFSVTLDWAAPLSMPFFVGAEVGALYDEGELTLDNLVGAMGRSLNPMMELSVMQGPANTLESLSGDGGKGEKLTQGVIGLGLNYVGQFKPTLSGQIARTIDPVRRNTTSDKDSASAKAIDKWVKKQKASIPFVSRQLPAYQTVWGEEERASDNVGVRILNNFFNPAYVKNKKVDAVDKEIMRLNEADPSEVILPTKLNGFKVGLDGEDIKLNSEDVTLYNRVKGKESKLLIRQLIQTKDYKDAADADKRKMIRDIFTDSGKKAKREALINHGEDPWRVYAADLSGRKKENVEQAKAAGFEPEQWFELQQGRPWDTNGNGNTSNAELTTWINGLDLTSEQKALLFDTNKANKKTKNPYAGGATKASASSSKKGRSGGRRRSGGRSGGKSKARAKTATEKAFTAATSAKLRSDIKSIDFNKINGSMSRSQRKALLKLIQKELKA